MPKILKDINNIDVEIKKFETKLSEFQSYLAQNSIIAQVTQDDKILLGEEDQDKLHKEITMQIKMQDALLTWLPLLKKLKEETAAKTAEVRGGADVGGMFAKENKK